MECGQGNQEGLLARSLGSTFMVGLFALWRDAELHRFFLDAELQNYRSSLGTMALTMVHMPQTALRTRTAVLKLRAEALMQRASLHSRPALDLPVETGCCGQSKVGFKTHGWTICRQKKRKGAKVSWSSTKIQAKDSAPMTVTAPWSQISVAAKSHKRKGYESYHIWLWLTHLIPWAFGTVRWQKIRHKIQDSMRW